MVDADVSGSDGEDGDSGGGGSGSVSARHEGVLSKWTNYIHGWQSRWMVLSDGVLSYYKSQCSRSVGCRGAISMKLARVRPHQLDECRLDVCVGDSVWYLRAACVDERNRWMEVMERARLAAAGSGSSLPSRCSSLSSLALQQDVSTMLAELSTCHDLMVAQLRRLQEHFDVAAGAGMGVAGQSSAKQRPAKDQPARTHVRHVSLDTCVATPGVLDFRAEAVTFKATSASALDTLRKCIANMAQREQWWRSRLQREQERCSHLAVTLAHRSAAAEAATATGYPDRLGQPEPDACSAFSKYSSESRMALLGGPDFQEGPHSTLGEDEFFDAVETALDRIHDEQELTDSLRRHAADSGGGPPLPLSDDAQAVRRQQLLAEVRAVTSEQLSYALAGVEQGVWTLFASDGDMRMYKREEEVDGLAVDPLKAVHVVSGVTAREVCWHFWCDEVRLDWETTVERLTVLEVLDANTVINLQLHKRVWPAAQRDSLFWSHIESGHVDAGGRTWSIVVNHSTEHDSEAARRSASNSNLVRVRLTACMACRDEVVGGGSVGDAASVCRDQLRTHIVYCAVINPGGWAPTSALRLVYKREFPRFLKRFTEYVVDRCRDKPIQW